MSSTSWHEALHCAEGISTEVTQEYDRKTLARIFTGISDEVGGKTDPVSEEKRIKRASKQPSTICSVRGNAGILGIGDSKAQRVHCQNKPIIIHKCIIVYHFVRFPEPPTMQNPNFFSSRVSAKTNAVALSFRLAHLELWE